MPVVFVAVVVWAASATVVDHGMAELAASLEPALLLVAIPVVGGLS